MQDKKIEQFPALVGSRVSFEDLSEREQQCARMLIDFLKKHPTAKHTSEGIARWWILDQRLEEEMNHINNVITFLQEKKIISSVQTENCETIYKLNKSR